MGFSSGHRLTTTHQALPLTFCGSKTSASTPVLVVDDENDILLVVQCDEHLDAVKDDLEPPLIASALAAFQRNNILRQTELAIPELASMRLPAIVWQGTAPTFYQVRLSLSPFCISVERGSTDTHHAGAQCRRCGWIHPGGGHRGEEAYTADAAAPRIWNETTGQPTSVAPVLAGFQDAL